MFKKITGWLHLWLGLVSGIVVFIVSLTGCIYVFHEELGKWVQSATKAPEEKKYEIRPEGRALIPPSEVVKRIKAKETGDIATLPPFMVRYHKEAGSIFLTGDNSGTSRMWYTFDPYTGEILDARLQTTHGMYPVKNGVVQDENLKKFDFFPFILEGHRFLWLPPVIGTPLVTYGTLVFVILLISGLILWWPKNKAAAKQRYWFRWKKSTQWRRKNYDLHNVNGFYMFLFLLLISLTGLAIGMDWFRESIHWIASGGEEEEEVPTSVVPADFAVNAAAYSHALDKALANELLVHSDAKTHSMYFSYPLLSDKKATMRVVTYGGEHSEVSLYDKYTGVKLGTEEHEEEDFAHQLEELYLPIHEGSIWGLPTKILAFIASFISASLPVTGFYIWWGRRKKGKEEKPASAARRTRSVGDASKARPSFRKA